MDEILEALKLFLATEGTDDYLLAVSFTCLREQHLLCLSHDFRPIGGIRLYWQLLHVVCLYV